MPSSEQRNRRIVHALGLTRDLIAWPLLGFVVYWLAYELFVRDVERSVLFCREIRDVRDVIFGYTVLVGAASAWTARHWGSPKRALLVIWNVAATSVVMWWAYADVFLEHTCNT